MIPENCTLYVHDVWDGTLARELASMRLGLHIKSKEPGYNRKALHESITEHSPIAVIISTPCWHSPCDTFASKYHSHITPPLLYVVNRRLWREPHDVDQLDFFVPRQEAVLFRDNLTALSLIHAINTMIAIGPRYT